MDLKGQKIAIFIENFFEDSELLYPYYRMKEAGAEVCLVGPKVESYRGKHGVIMKADLSVHGVKTDEFNALIIPGGYSPDHMRRVPAMVEFVRKMYDDGKPVAAICHAPWMLASAGLLKGKNVTSFFSIKDDLKNAGAEWIDQRVVKDGNIITSRGPDDLPAFCQEIIKTLQK
ncbi:MAG: type 1 glutamine amidotransferase domain-containing protein [Calditrichia bacterium]